MTPNADSLNLRRFRPQRGPSDSAPQRRQLSNDSSSQSDRRYPRTVARVEAGGSWSGPEAGLSSTASPVSDTPALGDPAQEMRAPISQRPDLDLIHDLGDTDEDIRGTAREAGTTRFWRVRVQTGFETIDPDPARASPSCATRPWALVGSEPLADLVERRSRSIGTSGGRVADGHNSRSIRSAPR